jgi:hypothetical protein
MSPRKVVVSSGSTSSMLDYRGLCCGVEYPFRLRVTSSNRWVLAGGDDIRKPFVFRLWFVKLIFGELRGPFVYLGVDAYNMLNFNAV